MPRGTSQLRTDGNAISLRKVPMKRTFRIHCALWAVHDYTKNGKSALMRTHYRGIIHTICGLITATKRLAKIARRREQDRRGGWDRSRGTVPVTRCTDARVSRYRMLTKPSRPVAEKMLSVTSRYWQCSTPRYIRDCPRESLRKELNRVCLPLSLTESGSDLRTRFSLSCSLRDSVRYRGSLQVQL